MAVGFNVAKSSSAGRFWSNAATPPSGTVSDLAYNNPVAGQAKLVAVGGTSAYTSTNGSTWTKHAAAFGSTVNGVAASPVSPYTFVAVGANNGIYSSTNSGVTWIARTSPITLAAGESLQFNDVFWTNKDTFLGSPGVFLAVGTKILVSGAVEGVVIRSYNGTTWTNGSNLLPLAIRQNNHFLSINGTATGVTSEIFIVGHTSNQFSYAGMILENSGGSITTGWQQVPLPSTPALYGVVPTNIGGAIAVGKTSVIISKLNDTTPPSQIVAPADLTLEATTPTPIPLLDPRIQAWLQQFYAKDNRDITILDIQNNAPATFAPNTVTPVSFTVSDKAGNAIASPLLRNITLQDMQAPVVTPPADITVPSVSGVLGVPQSNATASTFLAGATATDNVDGVINPINITNNAPALFPIGTTPVTFSATDSGMPANTGTATANVTVWDAQAPTIVLPTPAHYEIAATSANPVPITDPYVQQHIGLVTAFDNWDPGALSVSNDAPATFPVGTQVFIDFYATDAYGNVGHNPLNSASITVKDFAAPVITPPADITVPSVSGVLGVTNTNLTVVTFLAGATATDNVDGVINTITNNAPALFPIGTTPVTFSVSDAAGNQASIVANVTVTDAQAPTIVLPTPAHYEIAATSATAVPITDPYVQQYIGLVTAFDNWDPGALSVSNDAPATFPVGTQVFIDFYATDAYGNVGHNPLNSASITVKDFAAPVITPPADITIPSTSGLGVFNSNAAIVAFLAGATATDNVDGVITVASTNNDAPQIFAVGTTTVTFFVDDAQGNRGYANAKVTVWDAQAPTVYLPTPSALTLSAETSAGLPVSDPYVQQFINAVIALDDYEGSRTVSNDAPANFALNATVDITFTATDTYGNVGTAVGSITVVDDTPPTLTVPSDISVLATSALGTDLSNALIQTFLAGASATDNVDTSVTVFNDAPSVFPIGTTKVTFFADDAGGNRSIGSASVKVTTGSGGTPDAASCIVGSSSGGQSGGWAWMSLLMLMMGVRITRKRKQAS